MHSVKLMLILDDVELGMGLARIAMLSFQIGDLTSGDQAVSDAGNCYARAERLAANLSPADQETAAARLAELRRFILQAPEVRAVIERRIFHIGYTPCDDIS